MKTPCIALLVILALLSVAGGAVEAKPMRIMSLNMCTDGLLLDLAEPSRITSISFLSRSPSILATWKQAALVPVNYGTAEEVLAQKPDLVLAASYTSAPVRAMLARFKIPTLAVAPANDFVSIRAITRQVAAALGEREKGEDLLKRMDETLADLARSAPARPLRVAGWSGGGAVPGPDTLFETILRTAGARNIASGGEVFGSFGIEELLLAKPDVLAYGSDTNSAPDRRMDEAQHPLVMRLYAKRRLVYPESLYACGVPETAEAARELRSALNRVVAESGRK
jgi:iron complex transport system substrate-binding protein